MTDDTAWLLVFRYTEAVYGKKQQQKNWLVLRLRPFCGLRKAFSENSEIKNALKVHKE